MQLRAIAVAEQVLRTQLAVGIAFISNEIFKLIPIRVQKRNFELRAQVWSIQRDKLFPIHSDFENYTLERELVLRVVISR